ncbi:hypothetical protein [Paramicrobacterium chengjingii]|uniref:Uncharacterized protein n=1 Tax=Paramicrobacterium chengjingii TaxID=2769067 RepID=A0ABX6YEG7_9MICO|nr:hypothetical protein [Microbacterium chengjingii]QPZ37198.1 hypothetical protein HCR76_10025 [Microbacterium chengjingii]
MSTRMRRAGPVLGLAASAVLVLGLSACSGTLPEQPDPGPESTDSMTQTETSSPEESTPTPEAWAITETGIGPFEIGMRYADALTAPGADVSELCEGVAQVTVSDAPDATMWVMASEHDPESTLAEISVSAPADTVEDIPGGPETDKGIGLGASVDDMRATYPDARELDDTGVPDRVMYYVPADDGGGIIFTATRGGDTIWQISVTAGDAPSYEPCA